ncbi:COG3650 family protein [Alteriqipengyuania sp. 357]
MRPLLICTTLLLAACQTEDTAGAPGNAPEGFTGIEENETVEFIGTEPFWSGSVTGTQLVYKTPEDIAGAAIEVKRFAGQGGLGYSGQLEGVPFDMTVTPGACSDAMSERSYPYTVTLRIGSNIRRGCAWTQGEPFDGPAMS